MIGKKRGPLGVVLSWGRGRDLEPVWLNEGDARTFGTDGPMGYPLLHVKLEDGVLRIVPACLMIRATATDLRRAADAIEEGLE